MRLPIRDGDHLRCSGLIGVGPDGTVAPDAEVQFRHAFERVAAVLAAAGLGFADIVEMTTFHVHLQTHWATFMKVKDEFVHAPVSDVDGSRCDGAGSSRCIDRGQGHRATALTTVRGCPNVSASRVALRSSRRSIRPQSHRRAASTTVHDPG